MVKTILKQWQLELFLLFVAVILGMHFRSYGETPESSAEPVERITRLQEDLKDQQATYNRYAPIAQQAKIAERHMTLANQRANTIREELKLLQSFQEGAK